MFNLSLRFGMPVELSIPCQNVLPLLTPVTSGSSWRKIPVARGKKKVFSLSQLWCSKSLGKRYPTAPRTSLHLNRFNDFNFFSGAPFGLTKACSVPEIWTVSPARSPNQLKKSRGRNKYSPAIPGLVKNTKGQ